METRMFFSRVDALLTELNNELTKANQQQNGEDAISLWADYVFFMGSGDIVIHAVSEHFEESEKTVVAGKRWYEDAEELFLKEVRQYIDHRMWTLMTGMEYWM
jgi:hypothetical protein